MKLRGIHHITAITSDPQRNIDFYAGLLGLRLVKVTVNFDDPSSYHLYYGDALGRPGSALTFFAWPHAARGTVGSSQVLTTSFAIPKGSLPFWKARLRTAELEVKDAPGESTLRFEDFDGLSLALVEHETFGDLSPWSGSIVPTEHAIRGFAGATLSAPRMPQTQRLLTELLGARARGNSQHEYTFDEDSVQATLALDDRTAIRGSLGAGTVHHIAFRVKDARQQEQWREALLHRGHNVSPVMDRSYFRSLYFREPSGVLFELATEEPGFTVDESPADLGGSLCLPPWMESRRAEIVTNLTPIHSMGGRSFP